jgi:hypothetical protein
MTATILLIEFLKGFQKNIKFNTGQIKFYFVLDKKKFDRTKKTKNV